MEPPGDPDITTHALLDDDGSPLMLLRLRQDERGLRGEVYERGRGWVKDARAFDVFTNGQDYDLIQSDHEVATLIAEFEASPR